MVSLATAKQHLRVDNSEEDALITLYLGAAVAWVENYTSKKLARGVVVEDVDCFGRYIPLRWGPAPAALTIDYIDIDDAPQTIADAKIARGRAYPFETWPIPAENSPISASYTAGYVTAPADLDAALLLLIGHWYANRETVVVGTTSSEIALTLQSICRHYRAELV